MATSAAALTDRIQEDFLHCKICFELYRSPRTLSCLHTFCEHCLKQLLDRQRGTVTCPECRTVNDLKGNVHNAKASFFINSLLDLFHSQCSLSSLCTSCSTRGRSGERASSRCLDCTELLCGSCAQGHRLTSQTLSHRVVSLQEHTGSDERIKLQRDPLERHCPSHHKQLSSYCCTCSCLVCGGCRNQDHAGHSVQSLSQAASARRPLVKELIKNLDSSAQNLTKKQEWAVQVLQDLKAAEKRVEEQISGCVSSAVEQLFAQRDAAFSELGTLIRQEEEKLGSFKEDLQRVMVMTQNMKEVSLQVVEKGSDYDILEMKGILDDNMENLSNVSKVDIKTPVLTVKDGPESDRFKKELFQLKYNTQSSPMADEAVPSTSFSMSPSQSPPYRPPSCNKAHQQTKSPPRVCNYPSSFSFIRFFYTHKDCNPNYEDVTGLCLLPCRDIVIADNANQMMLQVIRSGIVRQEINIDNRGWNDLDPFSIAFCANMLFFTSGSRLYRVPPDEDDDIVQVCNLRGSQQNYHITAYRDQYIAVSEGSNCCLSLYTTGGLTLDRVTPRCDTGMFDYVAVNSREHFIVSDTEKKCIHMFLRNGDFINDCQFSFSPRSFCVDKFDNIYVVEGKRVLLLSPGGYFERELFGSIKGFTPKLIAADDSGHVIMVNKKGSVRIYRGNF